MSVKLYIEDVQTLEDRVSDPVITPQILKLHAINVMSDLGSGDQTDRNIDTEVETDSKIWRHKNNDKVLPIYTALRYYRHFPCALQNRV